jgi:hypothetical protein
MVEILDQTLVLAGLNIFDLGQFRLGPPRISIARLLGYFLLRACQG